MTNRLGGLRPDAPPLAALGPWVAGVRSIEVVNPDQIDILSVAPGHLPRHDRRLAVEIWYPAAAGHAGGCRYDTLLRDGLTPISLWGAACRDAPPATGPFPLVILSHGYPGNRLLMAHLGENLATKGYVVAAIDHRDSTYADKAAFGSTLVNRPLDQRCVIDALAGHAVFGAVADCSRVAVIGYSMGAYGALVFGGAGVSQAAVDYAGGAPQGLLARHRAGSPTHEALMDPRLKAIVPIGPWGRQHGFWDADGMAGLRVPTLLIAGSADEVSGYETGMRRIFHEAPDGLCHLLTFVNAGHNAAAPFPAPEESWARVPNLDFVPFEHYADAVWDTQRMNNIAQHYITAFLGQHLLGQANMADHLGATAALPPGLILERH